MTVELTTDAECLVLHDAVFDRARRTWRGRCKGEQASVPLAAVKVQRLREDAEGREVPTLGRAKRRRG